MSIEQEHKDCAAKELIHPACQQLDVRLEQHFDFGGLDYHTLFEASDATAFQHPVWLQAFYRDLAPNYEASPIVITGRDVRTAELLFVLPLLTRKRAAMAMVEAANLGVGDYAQPVMRLNWQPPPTLADRVKTLLPRHDILNIRPIRPEALPQWQVFFGAEAERLHYAAHSVAVAPPFTAWRVSALDPSFAKYLDRKKKRLFKAGNVRLTRLSEPADLVNAIDSIANLRRGRFAADILQHGFARTFYAAVAAEGGKSGFGRIYCLKLDDRDVALAFGLALRGRFYYLLIGADYHHFGKHSPGLVLYDLMIEEWIAEGGATFDFTIGDENFKSDFGARPVTMHALVKTNSLRGRIAFAAFRKFRTIRKPLSAGNSSWGMSGKD